MIHRLSSEATDFLLEKPETGMGYQVIEATKQSSYRIERFVVYNANLVIDLDDYFMNYKSKFLKEGYNNVIPKANYIYFSLKSVKILKSYDISETRILLSSKRKKRQRYSGGSGAINNPKKPVKKNEIFTRLSAYQNDIRIDFDNKCLKPGSYTTTFEDYLTCVKTKDDPIDRYAIPNDEKINWAFYIEPHNGELYQEGIVQPAFGHYGGGIENYFADGTGKNTYLGLSKYGRFV